MLGAGDRPSIGPRGDDAALTGTQAVVAQQARFGLCGDPPLSPPVPRGATADASRAGRQPEERQPHRCTKPSVDNLIEGVSRTLEQGLLPLTKDSPPAAQAVPPVVVTLQRITEEGAERQRVLKDAFVRWPNGGSERWLRRHREAPTSSPSPSSCWRSRSWTSPGAWASPTISGRKRGADSPLGRTEPPPHGLASPRSWAQRRCESRP